MTDIRYEMRMGRIQIVSSFNPDDTIVMSIGPSLKALAKRFRGKVSFVNAPNEVPAELPRAVMMLESGIVQIGINRYQVVIQPPDHVRKDYESSLDFSHNLAKSVMEGFRDVEIVPVWSGVVAEIEFVESPLRSKTMLEAVNEVSKKLITITPISSDLANFQLQIGYKVGQFFRNYTIGGFESRGAHGMRLEEGESIELDISQIPAFEAGIRIVYDVNSKPIESSGDALDDLRRTIEAHKLGFETLLADLGLEDLQDERDC